MNLEEILETAGCEALNDWLFLNFGQTLEESLPQIEEGEEEEEIEGWRSGIRKEEWLNGYCAALRRFAWWKDGTQYVGSDSMTLAEAIEAIQKQVQS